MLEDVRGHIEAARKKVWPSSFHQGALTKAMTELDRIVEIQTRYCGAPLGDSICAATRETHAKGLWHHEFTPLCVAGEAILLWRDPEVDQGAWRVSSYAPGQAPEGSSGEYVVALIVRGA